MWFHFSTSIQLSCEENGIIQRVNL